MGADVTECGDVTKVLRVESAVVVIVGILGREV